MKQTRLIHLILNLLLATLLLAGPAHAIDCTKATTKLDKIICADPKLIEVDAKLNDAYVRAMTARSPEGKAALRASQKEWLKDTANKAGKSAVGIDENFAVRQAELEMPLNDVAQKIADRINADKRSGKQQIPSFEEGRTISMEINREDAFTAKLRSMPVEAGLGDKLAAALNQVSGHREYQSFDINDDGTKDFRIDVIGGTLQCSTPRYLVSSKSHPGKFDVLDFAPEDLCAVGGDGTGAGYNDAIIDGNHYVVAEQQEQASTRYEFYDVLAKPITGSRLDIAFNEHYSLSSDVSSCHIPGCAKLIGNLDKLFKEGTPAEAGHGARQTVNA
jgi:uncharacterized protein YecT (DUF1311 family)